MRQEERDARKCAMIYEEPRRILRVFARDRGMMEERRWKIKRGDRGSLRKNQIKLILKAARRTMDG